MASIASLLRVFTVSRKVCIASVVEARVLPPRRLVAVAALVAAEPVMRIVLRVTAKARRRRVRKCPVLVAVETGRFPMFTDQRETGRIVVKFDIEPAGRRVAVAANGTHRLPVRVVVIVAGKTIGRGFTVPC